MKRIIFSLMAMSGSAFGFGLSDIPKVPPCAYTPSLRDPFVDEAVSPTLFGAIKDRDLRQVAPQIETYMPELAALLRTTQKISGLAADGASGFALVNGRIVQAGQAMTIVLPDELSLRLLATSKYFGLGFEGQIESKSLTLQVDRISVKGIHLKLRGLRTDLLLEYHRDLSPVVPSATNSKPL